jgi:hypothetical protein
MDPRLMMEIRQLAESWCPTKGHHAAGWKAGFEAFAEIVDRLHKQNSITQQAWTDANTRRNPYTSALDQAVADHDEIAERNRQAMQHQHELAAARAFASDPHLLQNQLDIRDGKYTITHDPAMKESIWQDRFGEWHGRG